MTDQQDVVQKQLNELCKLYVAALPEKIMHLENVYRRCLTDDQPDLMELCRTAHSLAGSASIYSIKNVAELAREIELLICPLASTPGSPQLGTWQHDTELLLEKLKSLSNYPQIR